MRRRTRDDRGGYGNLFWFLLFLGFLGGGFYLLVRQGAVLRPSRETAVVRAFRRAAPAVVSITAWPQAPPLEFWFPGRHRPRREKLNLGSGIIVHPEGYILTNEHVVNNTSRILVTLADGETVEAEVWGTEPSLDLAVLKIETQSPLPYLKMGRSDDIMIGEPAVVIGNPLGYGHTCTTGVISALHRTVTADHRIYRDLIQVDAAVNPGNSGGPLLNIRGELVGITTTLQAEAEGIAFAIPIDRARQAVEDLIQYRYVPTGWLGVWVDELEPGSGAGGAGSGSSRVFISRVERAGPANGKLKPGDLILKWNEIPVRGLQDFVEQARSLRPGEEVKFTISREGKERKEKVKSLPFPEDLAEEWAWYHLGLRVSERRASRGRGRSSSLLLVEETAAGSPARAAGITPGDVLLRFNRDRLQTRDDFRRSVVRLRYRGNVFITFQKSMLRLGINVPFRAGGELW